MTRAATSRRKKKRCCDSLPVAGVLLASVIISSTLCVLYKLPSSPSLLSARPRLLLADLRSVAEPQLGRYGQLMLSFLRSDLPFTLFIPTPSLFEAVLQQATKHKSDSLGVSPLNTSALNEENVYALVSRIFGFSAIPRRILSGTVAMSTETRFESVSGFRLNLVRLPPKGSLVVNNIACSAVDIKKGAIVVHLVDGILMDADFEQSAMPFHDDVDKGL